MKIIFLTFILLLSLTTAFSSEIESIQLNDNSSIQANDISTIHLSSDKKIDFIELNEGSRVESFEIQRIVYKSSSLKSSAPISIFKKSGDVSTH